MKYEAFDGKEIEFDVVSVLGDHLVLTELKAIMTSYDLNDLEERKKNIKKAVEQLQRRKESVKYGWDKFKMRYQLKFPMNHMMRNILFWLHVQIAMIIHHLKKRMCLLQMILLFEIFYESLC